MPGNVVLELEVIFTIIFSAIGKYCFGIQLAMQIMRSHCHTFGMFLHVFIK